MGVMSYTGGARIGSATSPFPLGRCEVDDDGAIVLEGTDLGRVRFAREEVTCIEPFGALPWLGRGVRIYHVKSECPETVVFWHLGLSALPLAEALRERGHRVPRVEQPPPAPWMALASASVAIGVVLLQVLGH